MADILDFIAERESLFSGIAALLAISGVLYVVLSGAWRLLRRPGPDSGAAQAVVGRFQQDVRYTRNAAGHRLAWSAIGEGVPLVRALGWFTNLEAEWNHPGARACIETLAEHYRYIRYDARGMGLSERNVAEVNAQTRLEDLAAVIDATGCERVVLMGFSEGGSTAIQYAAQYPDRVSHLVLWGTFLRNVSTPAFTQRWSAIMSMLAEQWGGDDRAFHQLLTAQFMPDANAADNRFFNDMQRASASADIVLQTLRSIATVDVRQEAASLTVPTLVMHRGEDLVVPVAQARETAAVIPDARLVILPGATHWVHADRQAFDEILAELARFLRDHPDQR